MLSALIVGAAAAALVLTRRGGRRIGEDRQHAVPGTTGRLRSGQQRQRRGWLGRASSPAVVFAVVTCLVYVNQVLFTVYVLRVWGGDASFVARYLPGGWFTLDRGPLIATLARHFPAPELLAPTVLRVQAFLELPFVVSAYLIVCRWFSPRAYRRALRLAWPVSASYTAVFCLIEWQLQNPYTVDDIVIRLVAAVVVPLWVARLSPESAGRVPNLPGLLIFAASAAGLGLLVLVVYDTALLYNLGRLAVHVPVVIAGLIGLVSARFAARHASDSVPGPGIDVVARSFAWLLVLFFVPALPIRYGLGFGTAYASAGSALVLAVVAATYGFREASARTSRRPVAWLLQMSVASAAGLAGGATSLLVSAEHTETRLLWAVSAFFVSAVSVCALVDRMARHDACRQPESSRLEPRN